MLIGKDTAIRTPEFHQKKERERKIKFAASIVLFLILIVAPVYLLREPHVLIRTIEIRGNNVTKSEDIQAVIGKHLEGNYLFIIPKSNSFLYPKRSIETELLTTYPRLSSVVIRRIHLTSLEVKVEERTPTALYCSNTTDPLNPTDCYFLDASGYIFSEAPAFSGGVYDVYTSLPAFEVPLRKQYLDPQTFADLPMFLQSLREIGVHSKAFVEKGDEYNIVLSNSAMIMLKKNQKPQNIIENLQAFLKDSRIGTENKTLDDVLYIDLRFGNKIFYKFRDEM